VGGTTVTGAGVGRLKGLAKLKNVNVTLSKVTHKGIERLERAVPGVRVGSPPTRGPQRPGGSVVRKSNAGPGSHVG
jgi:hypothetical protein